MHRNNSRQNIKKRNSIEFVTSDIFYGTEFFSSSNSLYENEKSIGCKPDVVVKNNEILFLYEKCTSQDQNYILNLFKNIKKGSSVVIQDAIYRDEKLGIDDINFSSTYIFLEWNENLKSIRFEKPSGLSVSSRVKKYKKENFLYVPQLSVSSFDYSKEIYGIINYYGKKTRNSISETLELQPQSKIKIIGTENNDGIYSIERIYEDNDGREIIIVKEKTQYELCLNDPVVVENYTTSQQRSSGGLSTAEYTNGCLSDAFPPGHSIIPPPVLPADQIPLIDCNCNCVSNCLFPVLQVLETRRFGNTLPVLEGGSSLRFKDGCGAVQGQGGSARGPYQIQPTYFHDCSKCWCPRSAGGCRHNWQGWDHIPEQKAFNTYCEANLCPGGTSIKFPDDLTGNINDLASCTNARKKSEAAIKCCLAHRITKDNDCDDLDKSYDCMDLAKIHHLNQCKRCGSGNEDLSTHTCKFESVDYYGNPVSINKGELNRCDCYGEMMKEFLCVMIRNGYISSSCLSCFPDVSCEGYTAPTPEPDGTETPPTEQSSSGPYSIDGIYPVYTTPQAAKAASLNPYKRLPGDTTVGYHPVEIRGVIYYMPN